ncbi:hypothetical protein [Synechocystis sp. PCC 7509]|uniref:hypothetical protein n=1 Tax=Synechocystis sp. PCC 7509 TaxID=927677 RepID=UPI0002ABB490|nr:hypothetical protein [Synechocystis sp. PCC 7509]
MRTITTTTKPELLALIHEPLKKVKHKTASIALLGIASALSMASNAIKVSAIPMSNSWQQMISHSLPTGWALRLPSPDWFVAHVGQPNRQYIQVTPANQSDLTVNIFNCPEQITSCLVGSVAVSDRLLATTAKKFQQYQEVAAPIALGENLRGYLLTTSELSSIMWEQQNQTYTVTQSASPQNLIEMAREVANSPLISNRISPATTSEALETAPPKLAQATEDKSPRSPVTTRHPVLSTAEQLSQGEILVNLRYRQSFPTGNAADTGLTGQPTIGATWGVTDNLELTVDVQTVDNSGPGRQGSFDVKRINADETSPNFFQEITFQGKQRIWENQSRTQALSGVVAFSTGLQGRPYRFTNATTGAIASQGRNNGLVTSLELPYTISQGDRLQLTLSPKIAFLPDSHALYFGTPPVRNPDSFGTTFGVAGGVTYRVLPRLLLWGDAFVPFTGNNSINRETGLPARTVAFNAGLRYLVNPRLATDLFVSNTLGNTGAMSVVGDRAYTSLGLGVTFLPGVTGANRSYAQSFGETQEPPPSSSAGFAFLDGGTVANGQAVLNLAGGSQGILAALRYGLLDDLEFGIFLDYVSGIIDESEFGFSGKIRFLHQADGDPFTLSGVATLARSNNVLINLIENNRNEFEQRGLDKGGFAFSNEGDGELFIITLSAPLHYQFSGGSAVWLTPTLGFVQRNGLQIAGFNLGGSVAVSSQLDAIAEAGINLTSDGNAFTGDTLENAVPWTVGLRWQPSGLFGVSENPPQLEAYLTNRVGSSPFETLRVRADNDLAVGVGLVLPVQF